MVRPGLGYGFTALRADIHPFGKTPRFGAGYHGSRGAVVTFTGRQERPRTSTAVTTYPAAPSDRAKQVAAD